MDFANSTNNPVNFALIRELCGKVTGLKDEKLLLGKFDMAFRTLKSGISRPSSRGDYEVVERMKKKLVRLGREKDAARLSEIHRKLQSKGAVKNCSDILYLLLQLHTDGKPKPKARFFNGAGIGATSTPFWRSDDVSLDDVTVLSSGSQMRTVARSHTTASSSGISSVCTERSSVEPMSLPPSAFQTPGLHGISSSDRHTIQSSSHSHLTTTSNMNNTSQRILGILQRKDQQPDPAAQSSRPSTYRKRMAQQVQAAEADFPEATLLREVVYAMQGIQGQYIRADAAGTKFQVDKNIRVSPSARQIMSKLLECGWLFNKVRRYVDQHSVGRALGQVEQAFSAALHEELTEYYRLQSVIDSHLERQQEEGVDEAGSLTLKRLVMWTLDPLVRLRWLAALVDVCGGKKGGALASVVHVYMQHGDPTVRSLLQNILAQVATPIFATIARWIYDGELEDSFYEFFVASDPTKKNDDLWHHKYSICKSMVPSFLTEEQARKILLTGKSINFLRQVCHDRSVIRDRDALRAVETHQVETIFLQDSDTRFGRMVNVVYRETSRHLLEVLNRRYKLMEHLQALRRYMLIGQGDFIRHLMDLLEEDLQKPATMLLRHNMTSILETAIRNTNAQFDDADILNRLGVSTLEVSAGETGWDVFTLAYHVDGPVETVVTKECMVIYGRVFNLLWRAKRVEYILATIWRDLMARNKPLRAMPELHEVLHMCHIQCNEMVYFIQQLQYYINFEVLECSWSELLRQVTEAEDLDHIIAAHQTFLDAILTRLLLNQEDVLNQLRVVFERVVSFESYQSELYQCAEDELHARQMYETKQRHQSAKGQWGVTSADEEADAERRARFKQTVASMKEKLKILADTYKNQVQDFLVKLVCHPDASLRFLSFRLDFNEFYRAREPKLQKTPAHAQRRKQRPLSGEAR